MSNNLKSAVETLLDIVRMTHDAARNAPDVKSKKDFMKIARKAGKAAVPYLRNAELRERIVRDEPMSEEDWKRLTGPPPSKR